MLREQQDQDELHSIIEAKTSAQELLLRPWLKHRCCKETVKNHLLWKNHPALFETSGTCPITTVPTPRTSLPKPTAAKSNVQYSSHCVTGVHMVC
jgi:hypothetical protein